MDLLFLQTADAGYWPLLEEAARSVRAYCTIHGCGFETYFGMIRGYRPWHAVFNKICLLKRLLDSGYSGWVCCLDADAYVIDLGFDLRAWLRGKANAAFIATAAIPDAPYYNVRPPDLWAISRTLRRHQFVDQAEISAGKQRFGGVEVIAEMSECMVGGSVSQRMEPDGEGFG
jgi:hypothetical protein